MSLMRISSPELPGDRAPTGARGQEPRVRDRLLAAAGLMAFSAAISLLLTLTILIGSGLGR